MKKVTKLAAQLQPGDIFECASGRHNLHERAVILHMIDRGADGTQIYSAMLNRQPLPVSAPPAIVTWDAAFTVEVPDEPTLTPAQERVDELREMLWRAANYMSGKAGLDGIAREARELLTSIDPPEPPTVVEALDVMRALIDTILAGGDARAAAKDSQLLLERARRAGLS